MFIYLRHLSINLLYLRRVTMRLSQESFLPYTLIKCMYVLRLLLCYISVSYDCNKLHTRMTYKCSKRSVS